MSWAERAHDIIIENNIEKFARERERERVWGRERESGEEVRWDRGRSCSLRESWAKVWLWTRSSGGVTWGERVYRSHIPVAELPLSNNC